MSESAEDALLALAHDLVEEIAAGRALELAGGWQAVSPEPDELELADHQRDILELASFRVRSFQRVREGKPEQVHGYQETRLPGTGLESDELGKQGGWIPEAAWLKGEQEWKAKGEAAWKKHEWKGSKKPKTTQDVFNGIRDTRQQLPNRDVAPGKKAGPRYDVASWDTAEQHLDAAQKYLTERGLQAGQIDQDKTAQAYHSLAKAHDHVVSKIVPYAKPEHYPDISQHLQRIAGHMQDLDQVMGANPQATRKLLGGGKEVLAHAGEARREQGNVAAENRVAETQRKLAFDKAKQAAIVEGPQAHRQFMRDQGLIPPAKGAAAVHPNLGGHLLNQPGDTVSGHGLAHAPKPFPVPPDQAALQAQQEALAASKVQESALKQEAAQAAREEKLQNAALERQGISPPGTYAPFTDEQYMLHTLQAENTITAALQAGHSTDKTETLDGHGQVWKPERAAAHNEIVKQFLDKAVTVPSEGKGLIMGGLGGSGKSTVLKKIPEIDLTRYAVVNPDDIKEEMAKRGMVPQLDGLSPMESSVLVHEESSHVAGLLAQELLARSKNLAYDITMSSKTGVTKRLALFRKNGYGEVQGVFVHIPVETSVDRARARHRRGLEKYRQGNGLGGRLLPADLIRASETSPGSTANQEAFDATRGQFSSWQTWDNSGSSPKLTGKSVALPAGSGQPGVGITSVEDLMRQQKARVLSTEPAARAAEMGTPAPAPAGGELTWAEIAQQWPQVYGGAEGRTIGYAASQMARGQKGKPASFDPGLQFRRETLNPADLVRLRSGLDEQNVNRVRAGASGAGLPPIIAVYRNGVYKVVDGEHRAEVAAQEGRMVDVYVQYAG